MDTDFFRAIYLAHMFDWTESIHNRLNWLFVTLDSDRDICTTESGYSPRLREQDISFEFRPEGLWIFNAKNVKPYIRDKIAVPFSACYIFDKGVRNCLKPSFRETTDLGRSFTDSEISAVVAEIKSTSAIGYAADGCGLQWVSYDDELSKLVHQGFKMWQESTQRLKQ